MGDQYLFICPICGNTDTHSIGTLNGKPYCRRCIVFKGEEIEHKYSYPKKSYYIADIKEDLLDKFGKKLANWYADELGDKDIRQLYKKRWLRQSGLILIMGAGGLSSNQATLYNH